MDAKDTVLKDGDIAYYTPARANGEGGIGISVATLKSGCFANVSQKDIDDNITKLLESQASGSWNAREPEIERARKAGIQEVVEWVKEHSSVEASYTEDFHKTRSWLEIPNGLWQAKLKEWGVSPPQGKEVQDGT